MTSMLDTVDSIEYQPQGLAAMNIFTPKPVREKTVAIESRDGVLGLIQTSERGAPLAQRTNEKRDIRDFRTTRIAKEDRIMASELQFLRGHGEEQQVALLQEEIARRLSGPAGLESNVNLTLENMRLGAIQGIVADADTSVLVNWYDEFNVTQATEIAFNLAAIGVGELREKCNQVIRAMARSGGGTFTSQTRVHALCGDTFFDALVKVEEVRQSYHNQQESQVVNGGGAFGTVTYGNITFENYRGTDDGSTVAIGADKVKFFPVNAPGAFLEVFSPGEQFEHIGQMGQRLYPMIVRDMQRDQYVDLEAYSYPLHVCTRPAMLQSGRSGA